ncbi:MAG: hypothetical protein E7415_04480 [Ruminococcaceae bacterium]|nr:hypothetical protein [Oscillospiraceae bacterium]
MKKFVSLIIALMLVFSTLSAYAEDFVKFSVSYPEGEKLWAEDYQAYTRLALRFADDKTTIPLSEYYDGYVYALVPEKDKDRDVEVFISEDKTFTDETSDYSYEMTIMKLMAARGVINGDGEGRANPNSNITRAEATAMVMRFLGLNETENKNTGFKDVKETDWHAGVIAAAKNIGLIQGDSPDTFSPNRLVSREEMVTMIARATWISGLQRENQVTDDDRGNIPDYKDYEYISDWARNSYETMRSFAVADWTPTFGEANIHGEPIDYLYAHPYYPATRFEAAVMLYRVWDSYFINPSQIAIEYGFDKEMPVIDGSTSTYPFTEAVYRNLFIGGWYHPDMPRKHSKSHASYERLINGEVDMLFASVYPASDILALAKEKGVELELIPIAYDAMIFFTNADNPIKGLTKEQISKIYVNNTYENWSQLGGEDSLLYPYCRNNDSGSHAQMERHFLNGNQIHEKIQNETTSVTMANVLTDVMDAKTDDPKGYGLGYSIYYYFNNMDPFYDTKTELKLLEIDGVYPTDETIADGSYPLSNNTYIVLRADEEENSPARKMAKFMLTQKGQECVKEAGYGPLKN